MGLDMYLSVKRHVKDFHSMYENDVIPDDTPAKRVAKEIGFPFEVCAVEGEVAYWRKANAIHNWFVENVQGGDDDCREHYVPLESLHELYNTCKKVLLHRELANELLPTTSGFFFGDTSYDDWYFDKLTYTVEALEKVFQILEESEATYHFAYQSSW